MSVRSLERLARSAFGFNPKLLIRRARFLRSLHAVASAQANERSAAIDPAYTDYSHFVRDAQEFLGMSPQAFLKLDNPMLKQSLALRKAVLGAPAQALAR
ncbi:helix-turn-helix domain-containing protein [Tsuneonella sp. HG249]